MRNLNVSHLQRLMFSVLPAISTGSTMQAAGHVAAHPDAKIKNTITLKSFIF